VVSVHNLRARRRREDTQKVVYSFHRSCNWMTDRACINRTSHGVAGTAGDLADGWGSRRCLSFCQIFSPRPRCGAERRSQRHQIPHQYLPACRQTFPQPPNLPPIHPKSTPTTAITAPRRHRVPSSTAELPLLFSWHPVPHCFTTLARARLPKKNHTKGSLTAPTTSFKLADLNSPRNHLTA
jgi:hypothetical protein